MFDNIMANENPDTGLIPLFNKWMQQSLAGLDPDERKKIQSGLTNAEWLNLYAQWRNQILTTNIPIPIVDGQFSYKLDGYQTLNQCILVGLRLLSSEFLEFWMDGSAMASVNAHAGGFFTLPNRRNDNVVDQIPGLEYLVYLSSAVATNPRERSNLRLLDGDWSKAKWQYPQTSSVPTDDDGKIVMIAVDYINLQNPFPYAPEWLFRP